MIAALYLFCGAAGGWSLGLHRAGVRTIAACEIDDWRRATFAANNPGVRMYADVRDLTAARLLEDTRRLPDWIVGSPPCQDASCANTSGRGVDGERTGLFFEAVRLVAECRPAWACFENVPGIRTRGADRVLAELEALGYACWSLVVGAWHAGAPHRRNRVWIIAHDIDTNSQREPCGAVDGEMGGELVRAAAYADGRTGQAIASRDGAQHCTGKARQGSRVVAGNAHETRLAIREGVGSDACPQLSAIERAVGARGIVWNGGPARHLWLADGVPARLARQCVSAYGDAVLPQIAEAIARSIISVSPSSIGCGDSVIMKPRDSSVVHTGPAARRVVGGAPHRRILDVPSQT